MEKSLMEAKYKQAWSFAVLFPVGIVSLLYILFKRSFAKIYLELSFFNAPIFLGEILLFYCLLMLLVYFIKYPPSLKLCFFLILAYVLWLVFKTSTGYYHWGALAFRHAALFYYPLFFIIGYVFFNRNLFKKNLALSIFTIIACVLALRFYDIYWTLTLASLGVILILSIKERKWATVMAVILTAIIPYVFLFKTARMMFVANMASLVLMVAAAFYLLEIRFYIKVLTLIFLLIVMSLGFYKFFILGESGRIFSSPAQIMDNFKENDKEIKLREKNYKMGPLKVGLFHQPAKMDKVNMATWVSLHYESLNSSVTDDDTIKPLVTSLKVEERLSFMNSIFRLFIWRDMFEEWKRSKPLLGFDFGRPLRSPSLEVMGWAQPEWSRDGWIEPHNSYFNILYRAGIIGIIFVVSMWVALGRLIQSAFSRRSWTLVLLAAVLLNWMVAANFLLILELPYTAIPFWTLAGMTWAYAIKS